MVTGPETDHSHGRACPRIALLEDNDIVADVIQEVLQKITCESFRFVTVADACAALRSQSYDLLILDWSLPDGEAGEVIRLARNELRLKTPILIESVREDEENVVHALSLGANDYVTKPLRLAELQARISALLRERLPDSGPTDRQGYQFDPSTRQLWFHNEHLELTSLEYDLAYYFFSHCDKLLSRERLLTDVWRQAPEVDTRTVDAFVSRLRKKLRLSEEGAVRIRSLRGYGYRLTCGT